MEKIFSKLRIDQSTLLSRRKREHNFSEFVPHATLPAISQSIAPCFKTKLTVKGEAFHIMFHCSTYYRQFRRIICQESKVLEFAPNRSRSKGEKMLARISIGYFCFRGKHIARRLSPPNEDIEILRKSDDRYKFRVY